MRAIAKGQEPSELTQYRLQPYADYNGLNKDWIHKTLLKEQGHLCAYCMQRIDEDSMKIEHWHSQSRYPEEQLQYKNLLACCKGNEGSPPDSQHCDTKKGNNDILFNPAESSHCQRMQIHYTGDGLILSDNNQFDGEINEILNLNWAGLKNDRKSVVIAVKQVLSQKPGKRKKHEIQALIDKWDKRNAKGQLSPYCEVAIYYLKKKLP